VTSLRTKQGSTDALLLQPIPRDLGLLPIDDVVRRLNRLCWLVNQKSVTGRLIQMAIQIGGKGIGKLNDNMYLNQVPHNRYVRRYFYNMAADAALEAVTLCSKGIIPNRMKVVCMFPEMNPSMDSYRYVWRKTIFSYFVRFSVFVGLLICAMCSVVFLVFSKDWDTIGISPDDGN